MPVHAGSISHMDRHERVIVPPYFGEFGWLVMNHIRYVEAHPAKVKVVFAEAGTECLYPTATKIIPFEHPVKTDNRWWNTVHDRGGRRLIDAYRSELLAAAVREHPDCTVIEPHYDCRWHTSDGVKVEPVVPAALPPVDVALGVRKRAWAEYNNYRHWQAVSEALLAAGLTVGICGIPSTSADVPATVRAWEHPGGATAGTVDLLRHCRLYVGSDTGVSHLAAMLDTPMIAFYLGGGRSPNELGVMQRANKRFVRRLDEGPEPGRLLGEIASAINCGRKALKLRATHSQHGEDLWLWQNRDLPAVGVFVEVGAGAARTFSNTYAFEEAGWSGAIVEPDPRRHEELRAQRKARLYTCAVGRESGWAPFGVDPNSPDLSGLLRDAPTKIEVETRPLEDVLRQSRIEQIDLLSIDTEGTELDVWASFDVARHRPRFAIIEWNTIGLPCRKEEITRAVTADGYALIHATEGNLVFEAENRVTG